MAEQAQKSSDAEPEPAAPTLQPRDRQDSWAGVSGAAKTAVPTMLVLSEAEVTKALDILMAVDASRSAFISIHEKTVQVPTRCKIPVPSHDGMTLFKPALLTHSMGVKVVSVRPRNAEAGLPTVPATILLFDTTTGLPAAVMGGTYLTAMRTAAGSGAATDICAKRDSDILTVFGAGMQADLHIRVMLAVRSGIRVVNIINRTKARAEALKLKLQSRSEYSTLTFNALGSDEADHKARDEATKTADIICTTTNSFTPLFDGTLVPAGCHVNCIGSYQPTMQEVDEALITRCKIMVDTEEALDSSGDLCIPLGKGSITREEVKLVGEYLLSSTSPRTNPADITLFKSVGTAAQDVCTAMVVLEAAKLQELGVVSNV